MYVLVELSQSCMADTAGGKRAAHGASPKQRKKPKPPAKGAAPKAGPQWLGRAAAPVAKALTDAPGTAVFVGAPWATERLSFHVWIHVATFLDPASFAAASGTCRGLRRVLRSPHLWQLRIDARLAALCSPPHVEWARDAEGNATPTAPP